MRTAWLLAMLTLFLTASTRLFAAEQAGGTPVPGAPAANGNVTPPSLPFRSLQKDPFKSLFAGQSKGDPKPPSLKPPSPPKAPSAERLLAQLTAQRAFQTLTVNCGMTMIPADPKMDAGIRIRIPEGGVKSVIQIVPPSICR